MSVAAAPAKLLSPARLEEALELVARGGCRPLAGGTDVYPAHVGRPLPQALLDLSGIASMRGMGSVTAPGGEELWRIGALESWASLREGALPQGLAALSQAAAEIGGRQVQNQGTLAGNLCNASPAADGVPVLLALESRVELRSLKGTRRLPIADFVLGNRRTAIAPDELMTAIEIPLRSPRLRSAFLKLGHRRFLVISIAMVAVAIDLDAAQRVTHCAIAVGACSAAARRLAQLESSLIGSPGAELSERATRSLKTNTAAMLAPLNPIGDVRGTARFRLEAAVELVPRALAAALSGADAASSKA